MPVWIRYGSRSGAARVRRGADRPAGGARAADRRRLIAACVTVLALGLTLFLVTEPVRVRSSSMIPTLRSGDQILVMKWGHRAHHPHRRDIIAFHAPHSSELLIKRVVGVAGDTVGIADGVLVVNRKRVHESFVAYRLTDSTYFGPVRVPAGSVFVMGDNRSDSVDSRSFGPVPLSRIVGRVVLRIWPPVR
jgi:signal peptidase I